MNENVGSIDKLVRAIIGIVLIVTGVYYGIWWPVVLGVVPIATALMSWCPAYTWLGINTCSKNGRDATAH